MQIREQGKQVQLIRSPYDAEKKRCVQKVVGHFPRFMNAAPEATLAVLTEDERQQLATWLDARAKKDNEFKRDVYARSAGDMLDRLADAAQVMTPEQAVQAWEGMQQLAAALRKAGHKRPVKAAKSESTQTPDTAP